MIGCLINVPIPLQGPATISMLRLRFSGGVDEVWAPGGEEERSEIVE